MTTHRIIVSVGLAIALGLLSGAAVSRTESAARSEPPKLVLEGKRALDIRVCEVEDDGGIMMMDQPDHFIISGGTLSNMIANGFGVTPDRVRGISDEQDIHIGIELAGELPGENRVKLMADAAAAFAGCRAALKKEPGDVYTISFGKTKPLPSAGKGRQRPASAWSRPPESRSRASHPRWTAPQACTSSPTRPPRNAASTTSRSCSPRASTGPTMPRSPPSRTRPDWS